MVTEIAVSSFSLRQNMGPVEFAFLDIDGKEGTFRLEGDGTQTLPEFIRRVQDECGVSLIELCEVQLIALGPEAIDGIADAMVEAGVTLLSMPIDVGDISHPRPEVREKGLRANIEWFPVASRLGAKYVRVNALSGLAPDVAAPLSVTTEAVRRLSDAAAELGMGLLLENKNGAVDYPRRMLEVVERVGPDHVGVVLDTGNFEPLASAMIGRMRAMPLPDDLGLDYAYEMIELMAPYATVVHAKSHGFDETGTQGPMDLTRALGIIRAAGFAGPVTVEYEGITGDPWTNTRRTVEIVRAAML